MSVLRGIIAAVLGAACVAAWPAAMTLGDDAAGPTCEHFTTMGQLAWTRKGGDWIDAAGAEFGAQAFDVQTVPLGRSRQYVELDLTAMVRLWLEGKVPNMGLMLRAEPAGPGQPAGQADFHSKESPDLVARPTLKLSWADGSRARFSPAADTFLDCTSVTSLGALPNLSVRADRSSLLRFNLPRSSQRLVSATLILTSDMQYAGGARIGAYLAAPPFARKLPPPQPGLAASYPNDKGIAGDPNVLFASGFDHWWWPLSWRDWALRGKSDTVSEDPDRRFEPLVGDALRVRFEKGQKMGLDLRYLFSRHSQAEPQDLYLRYYLRFGDDWNPYADGGKLPGMSGTYGRAGWGMRPTDGRNGWSMRAGFSLRPKGAPSVAGLTALVTNAYHAQLQDAGGDYWGWNSGPAALLQNNRWYAVEQHVKLNTPGQPDGVFEAWIDGQRVFLNDRLLYRHVDSLKIETVWFDVYHGGTAVAPQDMTMYFDNVVIARRYIGPLAAPPH